jgi:CARDB
MLSHSAVGKLKAILVIDIIVVAVAAGTYIYLQNEGLIATALKPAEFTVTDLTINPFEAEEGEPTSFSINVTNIGDLEGEYIANLTINNALVANQSIILPGNNNSTIVEFSYLAETVGNYTVELGGLTGSFRVKEAPPSASSIRLSNMLVNPYEGWVDQPINVTVVATNQGSETDTLSVRLYVDDALVENRKIELGAGETSKVEFTFNVTTEGKHTFKVNSLTGSFVIVPTGYHTLMVNRSGGGSTALPFTLNGETHNTAYSALLPVGQYTLSVPNPFTTETAVFRFDYWSNGDTSTTTTVNLQSRLIIVASYTLISGYASCPSLFVWNGTDYVYVTDVANAGWLGYIDYINEKGDIVFGGGNPWDFVKLDNNQLAERDVDDGYYDLVLFQQWNELFYLDSAYMVVVDHPAGTEAYTTMVNYGNQAFNGQVYTVSSGKLKAPISATNEKGQDVLSQISGVDGIFTSGSNGFESPSWDNITFNQLTLDLGNLSSAQEIKLLIRGMVDWGSAESYYKWIAGFQSAFAEGLVPYGTQLYPPPFMEVKTTTGQWERVPMDKQIPTPSDFVPRTFAVDLTGIFPEDTSNYEIRITNFFNVTYDYIGIDTTPQASATIQRIDATASLEGLDFGSTSSAATGNFTRYGDVTPLLLEADDMYVIGLQGDKVTLEFPTADLKPLDEGMERDYFLFVAAWFKDPPGNWGYGFDFTVDPLPFLNMSGFPYPLTESYPFDQAHLQYLQEYNTRVVNPP